ncbi:MAG: mechanosensitive ion channel [Clostridia bacterium]|nr:mechanosensitive ion channel [Clostridia bacterium]
MTWADIWESIQHFFLTSGITLVKAILLWIIGYVVVRVLIVVVKKLLSKSKIDKVAQGFIVSMARFILYLILLIMILQALGVSITGIVAALSAAGLAVSLALQNSLSNVASGIILLINQPFRQGDYVQINGIEGKVKNIKIFTTALLTVDNKLVVLPNSMVAGNPIINYSNRKTRRVDFTFQVAYESDVELVKKVVLNVMKSDGRVLLTPEPTCRIKTYNDSSIDFFSNCWCDSDDYWDVYYYVMDNVFNEFKRNNISIPYKQVEVRLREDEVKMPVRAGALKERVEKVRKQEKVKSLDNFFDRLEDGDTSVLKLKKDSKEQKQKLKAEKKALKEQKKQEKLHKNQENTIKEPEKVEQESEELKEIQELEAIKNEKDKE